MALGFLVSRSEIWHERPSARRRRRLEEMSQVALYPIFRLPVAGLPDRLMPTA